MPITGNDANTLDSTYRKLLTVFIAVRQNKSDISDLKELIDNIMIMKDNDDTFALSSANFIIDGTGWIALCDEEKFPFEENGKQMLTELLTRFNNNREVVNYDAEYKALSFDQNTETNTTNEGYIMSGQVTGNNEETAEQKMNIAADEFDKTFSEASAKIDETAAKEETEESNKTSVEKVKDFLWDNRKEIAIGAAITGVALIGISMLFKRNVVTPDVVILDEMLTVADNSELF